MWFQSMTLLFFCGNNCLKSYQHLKLFISHKENETLSFISIACFKKRFEYKKKKKNRCT